MPLGPREWKGGLFSDGTAQESAVAGIDGDTRAGTYGPFIFWPVFGRDIIPSNDNVRNQMVWAVDVTEDSGGTGQEPPDPSFNFGWNWVWWDVARFRVFRDSGVGYYVYEPGSYPAYSNVQRKTDIPSTVWFRWHLVVSGTNTTMSYSVGWRIGFRPLL